MINQFFCYNSTNLELICPLYIKKDIICCALFYLFVFLVQNDWLLGYLLFFYFLFIIIRFRYFLMGLLFCNILLKSRETIKFSKNYLKICFNLSQKFFLLNVFLFVDIIILFNYYCIQFLFQAYLLILPKPYFYLTINLNYK